MFSVMKKMKPVQKALYTLFIGLAVVSFWRGAWGLMDLYLFPNNLALSFWISIIAGLFILGVTHYWSKELV